MQMQVEHRLAPILIAIHDHPVPGFRNAEASGKFLCGKKKLPNQRRGFSIKIIDGGDLSFGNNQHMVRGLGMDILKCEDGISFE